MTVHGECVQRPEHSSIFMAATKFTEMTISTSLQSQPSWRKTEEVHTLLLQESQYPHDGVLIMPRDCKCSFTSNALAKVFQRFKFRRSPDFQIFGKTDITYPKYNYMFNLYPYPEYMAIISQPLSYLGLLRIESQHSNYNVKKNMTTQYLYIAKVCQSPAYRQSELFCCSIMSIPMVMPAFDSGAGLGKQTDWCNKCKCREFKSAADGLKQLQNK
ncbi:hypothetical protein YC2023_039469 [Brassica napus]